MTPEELRASLVVAIDDVHFGLFEKMDHYHDGFENEMEV
jgi:hypothetical protein